MTINPTGKRVEERGYASERKGEIIYRLVGPVTKAVTDDVRTMQARMNRCEWSSSTATCPMAIGCSGRRPWVVRSKCFRSSWTMLPRRRVREES